MTFFYSSWVTNLAEVSTGLKPTSLCCPVTVFSPRLSLSQLTKPSDGLTSRPFFLLFILFSPIIIQSNTCSVKKMQESPQEKKKKSGQLSNIVSSLNNRLEAGGPVMHSSRGHGAQPYTRRGPCTRGLVNKPRSIMGCKREAHGTKPTACNPELSDHIFPKKWFCLFSPSPPCPHLFHKCTSLSSFHSHSLALFTLSPSPLRERVR